MNDNLTGRTLDTSNANWLQAVNRTWDCVIIGAGVAGGATAIHAAKLGLRVLLIEAKRFPREKVCGGCLNRRAMDSLDELGLREALRQAGAIELDELHIQFQEVGVNWSMPTMNSVRRSTLDLLLVEQAISQGVCFLSQATAQVIQADRNQADVFRTDSDGGGSDSLRGFVKVRLSRSSATVEGNRESVEECFVVAKTVVVASGLTRSALRSADSWPSQIRSDSRIGVQSIVDLKYLVDHVPDIAYLIQAKPGRLHMIASNNGYVGVCLTDGGYVDLAAAIDPNCVKGGKSISRAVSAILSECGYDCGESLSHCQWLATPLLTRQSDCVSKPGVFLAGDSLGYIEPFTGEGMSWALDNAKKLAPILSGIVENRLNHQSAQKEWESYVANQRRFRQRICRWVARQARRPYRSKWFLRCCQWFPMVRNKLLREAIQ